MNQEGKEKRVFSGMPVIMLQLDPISAPSKTLTSRRSFASLGSAFLADINICFPAVFVLGAQVGAGDDGEPCLWSPLLR